MSPSSPPKPSFHSQSPPQGSSPINSTSRRERGGEWELPLRTGLSSSSSSAATTSSALWASKSASSSRSKSQTTTNISALLAEEPKSYVHKVEILVRLKNEIKRLQERLKEEEKSFKEKEDIYHEQNIKRDSYEKSLLERIHCLEERNRELQNTIEEKAREEEINMSLKVTIEEQKQKELSQGKEITNLKNMVEILNTQNEDLRSSLKILQEAHSDLVQRLKADLHEEKELRAQLEIKVIEKDKSFDRFTQDQGEICDDLRKKNQELEELISSMTSSRLAAMKKHVRNTVKRCLAMTAEESLGWSFGKWRDDYRDAKERERVITQRVRMALENRFMATKYQRLSWGFDLWRDTTKRVKEIDDMKTRIRAALERRLMTTVHDRKSWAFHIFKNALQDARKIEAILKRTQLEEAAAAAAVNDTQDVHTHPKGDHDDDDDEYFSRFFSPTMEKNRNKNRDYNSSVRSVCSNKSYHTYEIGAGLRIHTPILDQLCTKYGVR